MMTVNEKDQKNQKKRNKKSRKKSRKRKAKIHLKPMQIKIAMPIEKQKKSKMNILAITKQNRL
jgi:hypothetical protein